MISYHRNACLSCGLCKNGADAKWCGWTSPHPKCPQCEHCDHHHLDRKRVLGDSSIVLRSPHDSVVARATLPPLPKPGMRL